MRHSDKNWETPDGRGKTSDNQKPIQKNDDLLTQIENHQIDWGRFLNRENRKSESYQAWEQWTVQARSLKEKKWMDIVFLCRFVRALWFVVSSSRSEMIKLLIWLENDEWKTEFVWRSVCSWSVWCIEQTGPKTEPTNAVVIALLSQLYCWTWGWT